MKMSKNTVFVRSGISRGSFEMNPLATVELPSEPLLKIAVVQFK